MWLKSSCNIFWVLLVITWPLAQIKLLYCVVVVFFTVNKVCLGRCQILHEHCVLFTLVYKGSIINKLCPLCNSLLMISQLHQSTLRDQLQTVKLFGPITWAPRFIESSIITPLKGNVERRCNSIPSSQVVSEVCKTTSPISLYIHILSFIYITIITV